MGNSKIVKYIIMKKIFFIVLLFGSFSSFASNETLTLSSDEHNKSIEIKVDNSSNYESDLFFGLCKYNVASLDDDGKVLEFIKEEKQVSGRTDCLKWVNKQLEDLTQKGYCLGEEQVQYFVE